MGRYSANVVFALVALVAIGGLLHLATAPAPAQHGANVHVTGKVVDKLLKHFEGSHGLTGVRAIEYRRFTMAPGATMSGDMVFDDHADLCIVEKGSVIFTMADGSTRTFRAGDVYITPRGAKQKRAVADPKLGFQELMWVIKVKGH